MLSGGRERFWGEVVCALELRPQLQGGLETRFVGQRRGVRISLRWTPGRPERPGAASIEVSLDAEPGGIELLRAVPRVDSPVLGTLSTGDAAFDQAVCLFGAPAALARLDDETRAALAEAAAAGAWISASRLGVDAASLERWQRPVEVVALVERLVAAAQRLTRGRSIGQLIAGAHTDGAARVREAMAAAVEARLPQAGPEDQVSAARNIAAHMPEQAAAWLRVLTRRADSDAAVLALIDAITTCTGAGADTGLDAELVQWMTAHQAEAVRRAAQRAMSQVIRQLIVSLRGPDRDARVRHLLELARSKPSLVEAICQVLVEDRLPNAHDWLTLMRLEAPEAEVVRLKAWARVTPGDPAPLIALLGHEAPTVRAAAGEALAAHLFAHLSRDRLEAAMALAPAAAAHPELRRAAAHVCTRARPPGAVDWWLAVPVDADADPAAAADVAAALEALGDARAEGRLLEWLDMDDPARRAAVEALGVLGTATAALALRSLAGGFLVGGALKRAARAAADAIEARVSAAPAPIGAGHPETPGA